MGNPRTTWENVHQRFYSKTRRMENGCLEWVGAKDQYGYGNFVFGGKTWKAHRFAWFLERGELPEGMDALHDCDNPSCVDTNHMFSGTHAENMQNMIQKGRGSNQAFTVEQIKAIRESTLSSAVLARFHGVTPSAISNIRRRVTWRHI